MTTAKVKTLQQSGGSWNQEDGTEMFPYEIELSDGTVGEVNSTRNAEQGGPPYKPGDEVEYKVVREHKGVKKLRVKKKGSYSGGGGGKKSNRDEALIFAEWAMGQAQIYVGTHGYGQKDGKDRVEPADHIEYMESIARGMASAAGNVAQFIREEKIIKIE